MFARLFYRTKSQLFNISRSISGGLGGNLTFEKADPREIPINTFFAINSLRRFFTLLFSKAFRGGIRRNYRFPPKNRHEKSPRERRHKGKIVAGR